MFRNAVSTLLLTLSVLTASLLPFVCYAEGGPEIQLPISTTKIDSTPQADRKKLWLVTGATAAAYSGTLVLLNNAWYKDEARGSFHFFNDNKEWLQMDKAGHIWTAYSISRGTTEMWQWAGLERRKAVLAGGISSVVFLTGIELLDGYSTKWGWSWGDVGANIAGAAAFVGQELGWQEQRIQVKFSFHGKSYSDPILRERANQLYGSGWSERMLKDYNAQTYWLSANIKSFLKDTRLPPWLNIAVGYGGDGMFGGFENTWTAGDPPEAFDRRDIRRTRQYYLAPDIDFTKIPTKSKFLKTTFFLLNAFKMPAPTFMIDGRGKMKGYFLYF